MSDAIRRFIVDELRFDGSAEDLTDDLPLIESGIVDSLGIFELVGFLEQQYGVEIDDGDIVPENFGSVAALDRLIAQKRRATA